jgi:hypothetical protein
MRTEIDIDKAISLLNNKKTTIGTLCEFLYTDIKLFQDKRESFYLNEFKTKCEQGYVEIDVAYSEEFADQMFELIQEDTRVFSLNYAAKSIDIVLDAMNQRKFKSVASYNNLLVMLTSLKELNEDV